MSHEWESHTGEALLRVTAESEEEVFAEAADALARYVELGSGGEHAVREVTLEAGDRATLLVDWLGELVFLAETEGFVPDRVEARLDGDRLDARLEGRITEVDPLVKAATYHDLSFQREGEVWQARVVLDV